MPHWHSIKVWLHPDCTKRPPSLDPTPWSQGSTNSITLGRGNRKRFQQSMIADQNTRNSIFDLPFVARLATNGNRKLVSSYFWSTFIDSINVFDCHLNVPVVSISSGEALFIGWCILALTLRLLKTPKNSEDSGEVLQYAAFHRGLRRRRPIICNIG